MKVTRFNEAKAYSAPNHFDMRSIRLQGFEAGGPEVSWVGLSHFLPGGGAGPDSSPLEKVYVLISGELVVTVDGVDTVLKPMDSCCIPGDEVRTVKNRSNEVATMLVVMPYPKKDPA